MLELREALEDLRFAATPSKGPLPDLAAVSSAAASFARLAWTFDRLRPTWTNAAALPVRGDRPYDPSQRERRRSAELPVLGLRVLLERSAGENDSGHTDDQALPPDEAGPFPITKHVVGAVVSAAECLVGWADEGLAVDSETAGGAGQSAEVAEDESKDVTCSEDGCSLRWGDSTFTFNKTQGAGILRLVRAYNGQLPDVGSESLIESFLDHGVSPQKVSAVYRDHPAWGNAIVSTAKGVYRIAEPAQETPE